MVRSTYISLWGCLAPIWQLVYCYVSLKVRPILYLSPPQILIFNSCVDVSQNARNWEPPLVFCDSRMMCILRLVNRIVVQRAILKQEVFITSVNFNSTHGGTSRWADQRVFYKSTCFLQDKCGWLKIACLFCVLLLVLHVLSIRNTFYSKSMDTSAFWK